MATRKTEALRGEGAESNPSGVSTTPLSGYDHSFTLQAVMEVQKSLGSIESSIKNLSEKIEAESKSVTELKAKIGKVEKIIYAAGVVLAVLIVVGGWTINTAKDFALTYFKSSTIESPPPKAPSNKQ